MRRELVVSNHNLESLYIECPQLKEKAIVDFINGLEVTDDLIRFREEVNSGFCSRIWQDLTGQTHMRQQQLDQNMAAGLHAVSDWLQVLQSNQVQSDLAITKISNKLSETRQGVMRLYLYYNELKTQVDDLMDHFDQLDDKFSKLEHKLQQVDAGRLAAQQMNAVYDKWEAGGLNEYPLLIRFYLVLDEMYWGDFGTYYRQHKSQYIEINRFIEQVKNKAKIQLKRDMQKINMNNEQPFIWRSAVRDSLRELNADRQHALAFLSNNAEQAIMPMPWLFNQYLTNQSVEELAVDNVPYILDADNAVEHMTRNFIKRYEYEQQ